MPEEVVIRGKTQRTVALASMNLASPCKHLVLPVDREVRVEEAADREVRAAADKVVVVVVVAAAQAWTQVGLLHLGILAVEQLVEVAAKGDAEGLLGLEVWVAMADAGAAFSS